MKKYTKAALSILQVPPSQRSASDIENLVNATYPIKYFSKLAENDPQLHIGCCRVMTVKRVEADEFVFHHGEIGDSFYIILEGKVKVLIPEQILDSESEKIFREVAEIGIGGSFGELALKNDKPRSASVRCIEPSIFAVVLKSDFDLILDAYETQMEQRVSFLKSLSLFSYWTKSSLQTFCLNFGEIELKNGHSLFREGDPASNVYLIRTGQVKILKNFEFQPFPDNKIGREFRARQHHRRFRSDFIKKTNLQISTKGVKDIFGFEEHLSGQEYRMFSCVCIADAKIYEVPVKEFLSKLDSSEERKMLKNYSKNSIKWNQERMNSLKEVEVYKHEASHTSLPFIMKIPIPPAPNSKIREFSESPSRELPSIVSNLIKPLSRTVDSRFSSNQKEAYTSRNEEGTLFDTEVPAVSNRRTLEKRVSLMNYVTPIKLRMVTVRKKIHDRRTTLY